MNDDNFGMANKQSAIEYMTGDTCLQLCIIGITSGNNKKSKIKLLIFMFLKV